MRQPSAFPLARSRRHLALALILVVLSLAAPWTASVQAQPAGEGSAAAGASLDPVVADVVRMLAAGVDAAVITDWLQRGPRRPGPLSADDLIALTQAQAPEPVLRLLLDLSGSVAPAAPALAAAAPPAPALAAAGDGGAVVNFRIRYLPQFGEDEAIWDLYLYLNGEPLAWVGYGGLSVFSGPTEFERLLPPGRHVLRMLQERHTERRGGDWFHETRVAARELVLEVSAGSGWVAQLELTQPRLISLDGGARIDWQVSRNGEVHQNQQLRDELPGDWPPLCDDLEANLGGKEVPRALRSEFRRCVRWESLWPAGVPDRSAVRDELARFNFRPVPATKR